MLAFINTVIPILLIDSILDYNRCGKMFEKSKVIETKDKEGIKKALDLGDNEKENIEKLESEYSTTYHCFLALIYGIDDEIKKLRRKAKRGETITKDFNQLGRDAGAVLKDVERYEIDGLIKFNTTEEGLNKVYNLVNCCHKLQKAYRNYWHSYADNYSRRANRQTITATYNHSIENSKIAARNYSASTVKKNETRLERDSRERYSDDELINFYGLEQEQIDELRENDLDPWNFNEEELTPEDFYYHDDFYQDKIKRGEEKEEP